ncbi:putative 39S ribosomal protein L35, mitochondrial [Dirofilaria immitis]|nr:putative 39S ribosomal protein L35, mitochondrial [Dirofilaria immitis]
MTVLLNGNKVTSLVIKNSFEIAKRGIARIPHWEYHIRFDPKEGRKGRTSYYYETCTKEECWMLDRMMTPFWLRPKYYINDPYEPYHVRHGIKSPRIGLNGKFARERPKILLEDSVADRYFRDR